MSTVLVRSARQLLTLRGPCRARRGASLNELNAIPDGAVLIRDGVIAEVGPTRRLENLAGVRQAKEIDACGRVVMPGFVDSHTHLGFAAHLDDDMDAARRVRTSSGQRIEARARIHMEAMARHGTTTVEAKTGSGADESAESKLLRVFSALQGHPLDLVPSFLCRLPHQDADSAAAWFTAELLPKVHRRKTAAFADVACNGDPQLMPLYDRFLEAARALGFRCKIHADTDRVSEAIDLAVRYCAVSIDHLRHAGDDEARRIGETATVVTLMPTSCFQRGGPEPPLRALIDAGAAVAIASNFNPQHSPTLNMQTAVALASLHFGLTIEEAISAATINGAHAVGRGDTVGSIEPGKIADLVVLNVPDYHDLRDSLGTNVVHQTIKNGSVIYREGEVAARTDWQMPLPA